jgi:hypothetical protein
MKHILMISGILFTITLQAAYADDNNDTPTTFVSAGIGSASVTVDGDRHHSDSASISLGQYIEPLISIELGYIEFSEIDTTATSTTGDITTATYGTTGLKLVLTKYFDIRNKFLVSVHGGVIQLNEIIKSTTRDNTDAIISSSGDRTSENKIYLGLGLAYRLQQNAIIRLTHERFSTDLQEFRNTYLSVQYDL